MAHQVRLHGGPWHGRLVAVQDGRDHFHIIEPVQGVQSFLEEDDETPPTLEVRVREGMYSRVLHSPDDFEWDGWRSHD